MDRLPDLNGDEVSPVAIIGDGVAALITFGVLCHAGLPSEAITVYGDSPQPLANLTRCAQAIGQERMRSESNGHLAPVDFPGLAWAESWQRRTPWPAVASLFDRYTPSFALICRQAERLVQRMDFDARRVRVRVADLVRSEAGSPGFTLYDDREAQVGSARHVILALGHGGLAWPAELEPWRADPRVRHAYEPGQFEPGQQVIVLGGGMAAAHVWVSALRAGCQVKAVHRRPLRRQPLNAARCVFTSPGIRAYQALGPAERNEFLKGVGAGSFAWRLEWELLWRRARRRGDLSDREGCVMGLEASVSSGRLRLKLEDGDVIEGDALVCATGFRNHVERYPLLSRLICRHDLAVHNGMLTLTDEFTFPALSQPQSICGVVGAPARWALPIADTFAGIKYAARRLAPQILG